VAIDRDETLRKAERLLRQGKLEAAIAEYTRVVDDQPRDWTTANLLGDLFVRSGQIERAVAQYARIAENLAREGFVSKATALYKKIVKIHPEDDTALLRAAELAAQQGLGADARGYLQALFQQRLRRSDRAGAAMIAVRIAELDPANAVGRLEAARMLAELGESASAAEQLRCAGQAFCGAGKAEEGMRAWREALRFNPADLLTRSLMVQALLDLGDADAARDVAHQAGDLRAVADAFSRAGRDDDAIRTFEQALAAEPGSEILRVATAQAALRRGECARAQDIMSPLADDLSPDVQLLRAEIELRCGRLEQAGTALDRYLASAPDRSGHVEQLAASIAPSDPDAGFAVIGALLRRADATGDVEPVIALLEQFVAIAPTHIDALEHLVLVCNDSFYQDQQYRARVQLADAYLANRRWAEARSVSEVLIAQRPELARHQERLADALKGLGVSAPLPAADPLIESKATPEAHEIDLSGDLESKAAPEAYDIDLSDDLEALLAEASAPVPARPADPSAPAAQGEEDSLELDDLIRAMRELPGRDEDTAAAARAYDRASEHYNHGDREAAVACLREAVRDVSHRFRASSMLARLARERGDLVQAIDWLERAKQSPAPTLPASHALLYELADTLQASGEPARALAVFLELHAIAPSYRDVATRIGASSAGTSGGSSDGAVPRRGPA